MLPSIGGGRERWLEGWGCRALRWRVAAVQHTIILAILIGKLAKRTNFHNGCYVLSWVCCDCYHYCYACECHACDVDLQLSSAGMLS